MSKASRRSGTSPEQAPSGRPSSRGPAGTARAGRREQRRPRYEDRSFLERHRSTLVTIGALVVTALVVAFVFMGATAKTYACTSLWAPDTTPVPSAGASPRAGYLQPDQGNTHVSSGDTTRYTYCPPASGNHVNRSGMGPIQARFYGPDDVSPPQGWIHNLEHGGLVFLYSCEKGACTEATFDTLRAFVSDFPNSPVCDFPKGTVGPVVARFDEMNWPFAALLWGRVLPLETLDTAKALDFFRTEGERTNPERLCQPPSPSPAPSASPSASPAASPSAEPSPSPS